MLFHVGKMINGELQIVSTKVRLGASQDNTPKGVFLGEVFILIFSASFKYFSIDQVINKQIQENGLLHTAAVHLRECSSSTCG
jgi:hypothetical protein